MTIKQKLIVFASSMVLVAMVIATLVSNVVFNNMLTNSAVRYLETASYSAQELLKARREQMHVAISWADEMEGMPTALARRDTAALEEQLRRVIQACPFFGFWHVFGCAGYGAQLHGWHAAGLWSAFPKRFGSDAAGRYGGGLCPGSDRRPV